MGRRYRLLREVQSGVPRLRDLAVDRDIRFFRAFMRTRVFFNLRMMVDDLTSAVLLYTDT